MLRRRLESRMGRRGKREFVQVLRLVENFRTQEVYEAVRDALRLGAISFDAVKHLVLCRMEGRPQRLDLELYPYLPRVTVTKTAARDYMALMAGGERQVYGAAGASLQGAEAADVPERVRQGSRPVRRRGCRPSGLPAEALRARAHRSPPSHGGPQDQSCTLPRHQEPRHLRLPGHAVGEQAPGHAVGTMRVCRPPRERHRRRQQRHRQDPRRPRPGTRRLPDGAVGRLHHGRIACSTS